VPDQITLASDDYFTTHPYHDIHHSEAELHGLGYETVGAFSHAYFSETRPDVEPVRTWTIVKGMVNRADRVFAVVCKQLLHEDRNDENRGGDCHVYLHRLFDDGSRLVVGNGYGEYSGLSTNDKPWSDNSRPRDLKSAGPGGVAGITIWQWEVKGFVSDAAARLHQELLNRSADREPEPVTPEAFVRFYETAWAQDVAFVKANAERALAQAVKREEAQRRADDEALMLRWLEGKSKNKLQRSLRSRGIFVLAIEPSDQREDSSPDDPPIVEAWQRFLGKQEALFDAITRRVLDQLKEYKETPGRRLPRTMKALRKQMELAGASIQVRDWGGVESVQVILHFAVAWDDEHGLHFNVGGEEVEDYDG
jgi:hypothetical protein